MEEKTDHFLILVYAQLAVNGTPFEVKAQCFCDKMEPIIIKMFGKSVPCIIVVGLVGLSLIAAKMSYPKSYPEIDDRRSYLSINEISSLPLKLISQNKNKQKTFISSLSTVRTGIQDLVGTGIAHAAEIPSELQTDPNIIEHSHHGVQASSRTGVPTGTKN